MKIRIIVQKIDPHTDPVDGNVISEVYRNYEVDEENRFDLEHWGRVVDEIIEGVEDKDELPF